MPDAAACKERYLRRVFNVCNRLDFLGLTTNASKEGCRNLSEIYTALLTHNVAGKMTGEGESAARIARRLNAFDGTDIRLNLSAVEMLNAESRFVLLGDPGSGKSIFVNFVALCLAGESLHHEQVNLSLLQAPLPDKRESKEAKPQPWTHGALLPLIITLRDFSAKSLPSNGGRTTLKHFWKHVTAMLDEWTLVKFAPQLKQALEADKKALILFDGLDEVPEAESQRQQILQMITDVAMQLPARILVTSRTYAYQEQRWRLDGFADARLAPFTDWQIESFVERWYQEMAEHRGMEREFASNRANALKDAIATRPQLRELAERPLLLTLMAMLHSSTNAELPEQRGELYKQATNVLLEWWEAGKRRDQKSLLEMLNVSKEALQSALSRLAYDAHAQQPADEQRQKTADIHQEKLLNALFKICQQAHVREKTGDVKDHLCDRAGLLISHGNDIYTFPHRTFQEYLAAYHLATAQDVDYKDKLVELVRTDRERWWEVALLAAAEKGKGDVFELANALCPRDVSAAATKTDAYAALLAAQAFKEVGVEFNQTMSEYKRVITQRLKTWLAAIMAEQHGGEALSALERAAAGDLLAAFGDNRPGVGLGADGLPDIDWVEIPAGAFMMGSDEDDSEKPRHRVTFREGFKMSRYPITNAQYEAFVKADGYATESYWTKEGWAWRREENIISPRWWDDHDVFRLSNHPVVGVSWYEAMAFCAWLTAKTTSPPAPLSEGEGECSLPCWGGDGGGVIRLPTEAEWEYAARGLNGSIYPWGNEPEPHPELANYDGTNLNVTNAVGCFPRGKSLFSGCEEMAGNVWEWCLDSYIDNYRNAPDDGSMRGKLGDEKTKVLRGGSWIGNPSRCRCAVRNRIGPGYWGSNDGFRVVVGVAWT